MRDNYYGSACVMYSIRRSTPAFFMVNFCRQSMNDVENPTSDFDIDRKSSAPPSNASFHNGQATFNNGKHVGDIDLSINIENLSTTKNMNFPKSLYRRRSTSLGNALKKSPIVGELQRLKLTKSKKVKLEILMRF